MHAEKDIETFAVINLYMMGGDLNPHTVGLPARL
jgi:hypothetical protein